MRCDDRIINQTGHPPLRELAGHKNNNMKKVSNMKRMADCFVLKCSLFFLAIMAMGQNASAYDYVGVAPGGQMLFYNIVDGHAEVTSPKQNEAHYGYKTTGNLIIPSFITYLGQIYPVTAIGDRAFQGCVLLTSVVIPDSVTHIGEFAFVDCGGLTAVNIPDAITYIGRSAFAGCSGLTSVHIGRSIQVIDYFAFRNCSSLTSLIIDGHATIRFWAFEGCGNLTTAILSVDTIFNSFKSCDNLTNVTLGPSLAFIGDSAFGGCSRLDSIVCKAMTPPSVSSLSFIGVSDDAIVVVPCGAAEAYESTGDWAWSRFNIQEDFVYDFSATSNDSARGTATIITGPTCENRWARVRADAYTGYHFDHWSDGNRDNPRYIVVLQDTHLVAYFASDNEEEGIEETAEDGVKLYQSNGQIVVEGAEGSRVMVYDVYGRLLATMRDDGGLLRFDVPAAGVYLVRVGDAPARRVAVVW